MLGIAGFLLWRRHMRLGTIADGGSSPKDSPISGANGQSSHSPEGAVYKQGSGDSSQPFFPGRSRHGKMAPLLLPWRSGQTAQNAAQVRFLPGLSAPFKIAGGHGCNVAQEPLICR